MERVVKIKQINLARLNNAQYTQFMIEVEKLIKVATTEKLQIEGSLFEAFQQKIQILTDMAFESRKKTQTKSLATLSKEREKAIGYLFTTIRNECKSHIQKRKEAGEILLETINIYSKIQSLPYKEQSVATRALINDFGKEKNTKSIGVLGLSETITYLNTLNENFESQLGDKITAEASQSKSSAKKLRKEIDQDYDEMITRAWAQSVAVPSDEAKTFVLVLNKLIESTVLSSKPRSKTENASEAKKEV